MEVIITKERLGRLDLCLPLWDWGLFRNWDRRYSTWVSTSTGKGEKVAAASHRSDVLPGPHLLQCSRPCLELLKDEWDSPGRVKMISGI